MNNSIVNESFDNNSIVVFIDTNIFEEIGFNFDKRNEVIKQYIELCKENKIKNVIVSVIDKEIKKHINIRIEESRKIIKRNCKWIYNLAGEKDIEDNLNKNLLDYERFKKETNSEIIGINDINPEVVMDKYFNLQYPFEIKKPNEFKDAFFLEAIFEYINKHSEVEGTLIITKDNGIINAVEAKGIKRINCCSRIDEVIDTIINLNEEDKSEILRYLRTYNFNDQINNQIKINISGLEEEKIDIDDYECSNILSLNVIKIVKNKITVSCNMLINLLGDFSCLDYDNSYYSNEEHEYIYKEYKSRDYLGYICPTIIELTKENNEYKNPKIIDIEEIEIDYESFMSVEDYFRKDLEDN